MNSHYQRSNFEELFETTAIEESPLQTLIGHVLPSEHILDKLSAVEFKKKDFGFRYEFNTRFIEGNTRFLGLIVLRSPFSRWKEEQFRSITNHALEDLVTCLSEDLTFLAPGFYLQWSEGCYRSKYAPYFHAHIYSNAEEVLPERSDSFRRNKIPRVLQHAALFSGAEILLQDAPNSNQAICCRIVDSERQLIQLVRPSDHYVISDDVHGTDRLMWWWNHGGESEFFRMVPVRDESHQLPRLHEDEYLFLVQYPSSSKFLTVLDHHEPWKMNLTEDFHRATRFIGKRNDGIQFPLRTFLLHDNRPITLSSLANPFAQYRVPKCWHKKDAEYFLPLQLPINHNHEEIKDTSLCASLPTYSSKFAFIPHPWNPLFFLTMKIDSSNDRQLFPQRDGTEKDSAILSSSPSDTNTTDSETSSSADMNSQGEKATAASSNEWNLLSAMKLVRKITQRLQSILHSHPDYGYNVYLRVWKLLYEPHSLQSWDQNELAILKYQHLFLKDIPIPQDHVIIGYFEFDPQSQIMILEHEGFKNISEWIQQYKTTTSYFYCL
jgi:hypothetical protein